MGKPLMLQAADAERIETLKKRLDARTKIDVVRLALDLLEREYGEGGACDALAEGGEDGGGRKPTGPARVPAPQPSPAPRLMTPPAVAPRRWHVYTVGLEPRVGTKPGKQRSCLAIQPTEFREAGLRSTVVLPLTIRIVQGDAFPLRVRVRAGICRLSKDRDILVDQILAWDNELFRRNLGPLPEALQDEVRRALLEFLDLL